MLTVTVRIWVTSLFSLTLIPPHTLIYTLIDTPISLTLLRTHLLSCLLSVFTCWSFQSALSLLCAHTCVLSCLITWSTSGVCSLCSVSDYFVSRLSHFVSSKYLTIVLSCVAAFALLFLVSCYLLWWASSVDHSAQLPTSWTFLSENFLFIIISPDEVSTVKPSSWSAPFEFQFWAILKLIFCWTLKTLHWITFAFGSFCISPDRIIRPIWIQRRRNLFFLL